MKDETILKQVKNPLLEREDIKIVVTAGKNPSFADALKSVAEKFLKSEENIAIKKIQGKFGRGTFLIDACIYASKEDKEKIEPKPKVKGDKKPVATPVAAPVAPAAPVK